MGATYLAFGREESAVVLLDTIQGLESSVLSPEAASCKP
jgi:hypothetical protein